MQRRLWVMGSTILLVAAGCTGSTAETSTTPSTTKAASTTTTIANPFLDVADEVSNFPAGASVDVVGLHFEQQSWIGSFPADDVAFFGRVVEFDRLDAGLVSTGSAASYRGGAIWEELTVDESTGYFPQANTGVIGEPEDVTSTVESLAAASADELIALIAETIAGSAGLKPIQITQREFGEREVYYDLIGSSEPASRGLRLRIVVVEVGGSFQPSEVVQSIICVHAYDESGACSDGPN